MADFSGNSTTRSSLTASRASSASRRSILRPRPAGGRAVPAGGGVARGAADPPTRPPALAARSDGRACIAGGRIARRGDDERLHEPRVRHDDVGPDTRGLRPVQRTGQGPRGVREEPHGLVPADGPTPGGSRGAVRQRAPGDLRPLRPLLRHAREQLRHAEGVQPPLARPGRSRRCSRISTAGGCSIRLWSS